MNKKTTKNQYINRELSWLQFNARVLQEADDESVPLIERLRFLGIFSNNLDEFFKVRYATVKRIYDAGKEGKSQLGIRASENIFVINENDIDESQHEFIKDYFIQKVSTDLVTIILNDSIKLPNLKDSAAYLAINMELGNNKNQYALIEISRQMDRFIVLPEQNGKNYILMIDDLLRYFLDDIFNIFDYESISAHMIKITRDGELSLDSDLSKSFMEKISDSVKSRQSGDPVRFVYDKTIDEKTLDFIMSKMEIEKRDSIIPGGRYHNRRDYMDFPSLGRKDLLYSKIKPLPIKGLDQNKSLFSAIAKKDYLQYTPYHTFAYVVK